jgi:hypothetical protein
VSARVTYSKARNEYRTGSGNPIGRDKLLAARDAIVKDTERKLVALTEKFIAGKINLPEWQVGFKNIIKPAHTLAAGVAMGGKEAMTVSDWSRVGQKLRIQYERLFQFGLQVEQGKKINMGRVRQYARAVRSTFLNAERLRFPAGALARWIRHAKESCEGCLSQAGKGVVPIENLPPIGSRTCRHNCLCEIVLA